MMVVIVLENAGEVEGGGVSGGLSKTNTTLQCSSTAGEVM